MTVAGERPGLDEPRSSQMARNVKPPEILTNQTIEPASSQGLV